jgi:hypothetical protein
LNSGQSNANALEQGEPADEPAGIDDAPELHDLTAGQHKQLTEWAVTDDIRHCLAWHATDGRTTSSKALTKHEQDALIVLARAFGGDTLTVTGNPADPTNTVLEVNGVEVSVDDVLDAAHGATPEQPPLTGTADG